MKGKEGMRVGGIERVKMGRNKEKGEEGMQWKGVERERVNRKKGRRQDHTRFIFMAF